jgi:hypothetical protein
VVSCAAESEAAVARVAAVAGFPLRRYCRLRAGSRPSRAPTAEEDHGSELAESLEELARPAEGGKPRAEPAACTWLEEPPPRGA